MIRIKKNTHLHLLNSLQIKYNRNNDKRKYTNRMRLDETIEV